MKNLLLLIRYYLVLIFYPGLLDRSNRLTRREVIFRDEFQGVELDSEVWARQEVWGSVRWTNNQNDYYDHYSSIVAANALHLQVNHRPRMFLNPKTGQNQEVPFAVGLISSHRGGVFTHGLYESRFKNPVDLEGNPAKGSWSAVWIYPINQWPPEVDLAETYGRRQGKSMNRFVMTVHYVHPQKGKMKEEVKVWVPKSWERYNVVGYEYTPSSLAFYINRLKVWECKNPIILEALKGYQYKWILNTGVQPKFKEKFLENHLPTIMSVDYVRVYHARIT